MRLRAGLLLALIAVLAGSAPTPHAHASQAAALFDDDCQLARLAAPVSGTAGDLTPDLTPGPSAGGACPILPALPVAQPRPAFASRAPPASV